MACKKKKRVTDTFRYYYYFFSVSSFHFHSGRWHGVCVCVSVLELVFSISELLFSISVVPTEHHFFRRSFRSVSFWFASFSFVCVATVVVVAVWCAQYFIHQNEFCVSRIFFTFSSSSSCSSVMA